MMETTEEFLGLIRYVMETAGDCEIPIMRLPQFYRDLAAAFTKEALDAEQDIMDEMRWELEGGN